MAEVDEVLAVLRSKRFLFTREDDLQEAVADALVAEGLAPVREVRLSPRDRIDVLVGNVGIEIKVAGKPHSVSAQMERYAASDRLDALVLVTCRARHRPPAELLGKPVHVVFLGGL